SRADARRGGRDRSGVRVAARCDPRTHAARRRRAHGGARGSAGPADACAGWSAGRRSARDHGARQEVEWRAHVRARRTERDRARGRPRPRRGAQGLGGRGSGGVMAKILLLSGPNLNLLGERDPAHYGTTTLGELVAIAQETAAKLGYDVEHVQSNHEGDLIDAIHGARGRCAAIVINAGAFTHYAYALTDALE